MIYVLNLNIDNLFQVVGEAKTGELCGEIGVLCYKPQHFTVRTKRLSQLLRLNRTTFLNIVQANVGDGTIIMNNLLQVCIISLTSYCIFTINKYTIIIYDLLWCVAFERP
jgi:CRP-like cAMP-binding protein